MNRRRMLETMAAVPVAAGVTWTRAEAEHARAGSTAARRQAAARKEPYKPKFFTAHEFATVTLLASIILPKDDRSPGAVEAGAPEFIDFMMIDQPARQLEVRGGLRWLDRECRERYGAPFVKCTDAQRTELLDLIAWPAKTPPELSHGARFFSIMRDLTATGFWTSRIGIDDLQYVGNTFVAEWTGCPDEALQKLGVKYTG